MIQLSINLGSIQKALSKAFGINNTDISLGILEQNGIYFVTPNGNYDGSGYLSLLGRSFDRRTESPVETLAREAAPLGISNGDIRHIHTVNAFFYGSEHRKNIKDNPTVHIHGIPLLSGNGLFDNGLVLIAGYEVDRRAAELSPITHAVLKYHYEHNGHVDMPELEFGEEQMGSKRRYRSLGILGASL